MQVPKRKESVSVDEIMDVSAHLEAGAIMLEREAEGNPNEAERATVAVKVEWIKRVSGIFRALCYEKDEKGMPVYEEWEPDGEADAAGATVSG